MIRIRLVNQKGGVGKTSTAVNLAARLAAANRRVLLIDVDPQGNATSALGAEKGGHSIYNVLVDQIPTRDAIRATFMENLFLLPSDANLYGAEIELLDRENREGQLQQALSQLQGNFDYVIMDGPPSLGVLTLNVLVASQSIVIPVQAEYYALEGLSLLLQTIERVHGSINPNLEILGILVTMFDSRLNIAQQVETELRSHFPDKVFKTMITRSVRLAEAPSHGKPVIVYDFRSSGAQNYITLAQEVIDAAEKTCTR